MRILIQTMCFRPELTGIAKIVTEMADWLVQQGHEVRVVTALPHYPEWRLHRGYSRFRYHHESGGRSSAETWRCPLWVPRHPGGLRRLLYLGTYAVSSMPVMLRQIAWRPRLVMLIEPPLACAPQALAVAKLAGAKSWLNIQDYELDIARALGLLSSGRLARLAATVERKVMRAFDCVSAISPAMLQRAIDKGVEPERTRLFRDWVDLGNIREDPEASAQLRLAFGLQPSQIVCLYSGNLGMKQGLGTILDAAAGLTERPDIVFLVCGEGAAKNEIERRAAALPNFQLRGLVPPRQLNALLHLADIHLLPQRIEASELVMPSKLLYMLASGRPIIATATPVTEVGLAVGQAGGILSPPGDAGALRQAVLTLAADHSRRRTAGAAGRELAEATFEKQHVLRSFHQALVELLAS